MENVNNREKIIQNFNRKWLFDKTFNEYVSQNILNFGYHFTYKSIDSAEALSKVWVPLVYQMFF